jgi:hypothetical protein
VNNKKNNSRKCSEKLIKKKSKSVIQKSNQDISKSININEDDFAMVDAYVDDVKGKLIIDICSNLCIVTKEYFDRFPGNYEQAGVNRRVI